MDKIDLPYEFEADKGLGFRTERSVDHFIQTRVRAHTIMERKCDDLLNLQGGLARTIYLDQRKEEGEETIPDGLTRSTTRKAASEDFQQLAQLASAIIPQNFPTVKRRFVLNGATRSIAEINRIEEAVRVLQLRMREIESEILEHIATTPEEAITKMRFIVGLLLDGKELETSYFAFQIEECTEVLSSVTSKEPLL